MEYHPWDESEMKPDRNDTLCGLSHATSRVRQNHTGSALAFRKIAYTLDITIT